MNRRRIMHVVVAGDIGGAERLLVDLALRPEATRAEHEVALFTSNPSLAAYLVSAGLHVHACGDAAENPIAYLRRSLGSSPVQCLSNLLVQRGSNVVHTHTFGSHVIGTRAAERVGLPQVRTEHHFVHYFDASCRLFTRWAASRTDALVAVSEYVRRVLVQTAPGLAQRMSVARNGIDPKHWCPRVKMGTGFLAGIVCRLTPWKRVHLAIRAAAMARVDLMVVGDGEERERLECLARTLGAPVRFVGYVSDPRPYIAECDVLLNTSDREPLGLSILEALSMARPVLAWGGGGVPEIVHDGDTGIVVADATPEAYASALVSARAEPERLAVMGSRGRDFVESECSIESMCEKYGVVYERLARSP